MEKNFNNFFGDSSLTIEERIRYLLGEMTLKEKFSFFPPGIRLLNGWGFRHFPLAGRLLMGWKPETIREAAGRPR